MKGTKRSTVVTMSAIVIAVFSLISSFGLLGISNSVKGMSIQEKEEWNVSIDEVSSLATDNETVEVIKEPEFKKFNANYGVKFGNVGSSQFEFLIKNEGNTDALVSDVVITGLEEYGNYIKTEFVNLNVGDVIEKESFICVKVITNCHTQLYDYNLVEQDIVLDNIGIDIKLEKVE